MPTSPAKEKALAACCGGNLQALDSLLKNKEILINMVSGKTKGSLLHMAAYCGQVRSEITVSYGVFLCMHIRMCVYMCVYCMCVCTVCVYMCVCTVCVYICVCTVCVYICVCTVCVYICVCTVCVYICVCTVCVYICVCVYIITIIIIIIIIIRVPMHTTNV